VLDAAEKAKAEKAKKDAEEKAKKDAEEKAKKEAEEKKKKEEGAKKGEEKKGGDEKKGGGEKKEEKKDAAPAKGQPTCARCAQLALTQWRSQHPRRSRAASLRASACGSRRTAGIGETGPGSMALQVD
jgi:hypothetical protein